MRARILVGFLVAAPLTWGTVAAVESSSKAGRASGTALTASGQASAASAAALKATSDLNAAVAQEKADAAAATAANAKARLDDCQASNQTRRALRQIAAGSLRSLSVARNLARTLFPNVSSTVLTQALKQAAVKYRDQVKTFAHRDCRAYARRALPR